jgi:hypothetical protein
MGWWRNLTCNELGDLEKAQENRIANYFTPLKSVQQSSTYIKILNDHFSVYEELQIQNDVVIDTLKRGGQRVHLYSKLEVGVGRNISKFCEVNFDVIRDSIREHLQQKFCECMPGDILRIGFPLALTIEQNLIQIYTLMSILNKSPKVESKTRELDDLWTPTILGI